MKTAVEWLIDEMLKQGYFDSNKQLTFTNLDHLQHQAKEMEMYQIQNAFNDGFDERKSGEEYYNEKFNKNETKR